MGRWRSPEIHRVRCGTAICCVVLGRVLLYVKPPCFMGKSTISMAIFHSYVGLPSNSYVGKTLPCLPSPSHHHFYRCYKLTIPQITQQRQDVNAPESHRPTGNLPRFPPCPQVRWKNPWPPAEPIRTVLDTKCCPYHPIYPPVNSHNYGKSPFLMGKSTISMAIYLIYHSTWVSSHIYPIYPDIEKTISSNIYLSLTLKECLPSGKLT